MVTPSHHPFIDGIFPYKPSIWGYPHFRKLPHQLQSITIHSTPLARYISGSKACVLWNIGGSCCEGEHKLTQPPCNQTWQLNIPICRICMNRRFSMVSLFTSPLIFNRHLWFPDGNVAFTSVPRNRFPVHLQQGRREAWQIFAEMGTNTF